MGEKTQRIELLDLWRTVAIVLMLTYHFLYDVYAFGAMTREEFFSPGLNVMQRFICYSFIILAGISSRFSRDNMKRGVIVFAAGIAVSLCSGIVGISIKFGVLSFLGSAMMIYALIGKSVQRFDCSAAPFVWAGLFAAARIVTLRVYTSVRWLWPLGFRYHGFYSADYFPIIPWIFLFLLGTWFGGVLKNGGLPKLRAVRVPSVLTWPGRHSLIIYLAHQPILYGICWLIFGRG